MLGQSSSFFLGTMRAKRSWCEREAGRRQAGAQSSPPWHDSPASISDMPSYRTPYHPSSLTPASNRILQLLPSLPIHRSRRPLSVPPHLPPQSARVPVGSTLDHMDGWSPSLDSSTASQKGWRTRSQLQETPFSVSRSLRITECNARALELPLEELCGAINWRSPAFYRNSQGSALDYKGLRMSRTIGITYFTI
jgi:hypothetical protein